MAAQARNFLKCASQSAYFGGSRDEEESDIEVDLEQENDEKRNETLEAQDLSVKRKREDDEEEEKEDLREKKEKHEDKIDDTGKEESMEEA